MNNYNFDTLCLHAGYKPDEEIGSRQVPIYQNASYIFKNSEKARNLFALKEEGKSFAREFSKGNKGLYRKLRLLF